jgi:hypothetical protein
MFEPTGELDEEVFRLRSFYEAKDAICRLFAACDTKWPDVLVPTAIELIEQDILAASLHLRRCSEISTKRVSRTIEPIDFGIERDFSRYESNLWRAINAIVHHHRIEAKTITQDDFYTSDRGPMRGHVIADVKVESDQGTRLINVAGFAVACVNEIGAQMSSAKKAMH